MNRLRLAAIGCGSRTRVYFELAARAPERYAVVAAADPIAERLELARRLSGNPQFRGFRDDREILAVPKLADVMIIATQDNQHVAPCLAALEKGYDILLEKPIATNLRDVLAVERRATELGRRVLVCHVLRYAPFYRQVKEIVASGRLGTILSLNATEGVGAFHQAHSFVRGHWSVVERATPMIVAKSCHDLDLIHWLVGCACEAVSSFGALTHFRAEHAPAGAPHRCTDGCPVERECPYSALRYTTTQRSWLPYVWAQYDAEHPASAAAIGAWLATSPWGRCVYRCDNTAVDHQIVSLRFAGDVTATFTMTAFDSGRSIEIFGTKARLRGGEALHAASGADIVVQDHESRAVEKIVLDRTSGHGGGDAGLVAALYDEMQKPDPRQMHTSIHDSVMSHVIGFAAEQSRRSGETVRVAEFLSRTGK